MLHEAFYKTGELGELELYLERVFVPSIRSKRSEASAILTLAALFYHCGRINPCQVATSIQMIQYPVGNAINMATSQVNITL